MKVILDPPNYVFNPSSNQITFTFPFTSYHLYAVINITTNKLVYSVASGAAGYGGSFSGNVLTYFSSNAGQSPTDDLQIIYDDVTAIQQINGTVSGSVGVYGSVNSFAYDGSGMYPILSTTDIVTGQEGLNFNLLNSSFGGQVGSVLPAPFESNALSVGFLNGGILQSPLMDAIDNALVVNSRIFDGSGNYPIMSSTDIVSGREGLDINLLNSSFGGTLGDVMPAPFDRNVFSVGFINGLTGALVTPKMNPMDNVLVVDATQSGTIPVAISGSVGTLDTNIISLNGSPISSSNPFPTTLYNPSTGVQLSVGAGIADTNTLRVINFPTTSAGYAQSYGIGQADVATLRTVGPDYTTSGPSATWSAGNNLLAGGTTPTVTDGYRFATIQVTSASSVGSYVFEGSNDNSTYFNIPVYNSLNPNATPIMGAINCTVGSVTYSVPLPYRFLKLRCVSNISGTTQTNSRFTQHLPPFFYNTSSSQYTAVSNPSVDVLNTPMVASKYNQIEIDWYTAPSASLVTTTTSGGATITQANGHSLFTTGTATTASAKAVTVGTITYRPANEIYAYFTAAFTTPTSGNSYQRIGMYDTNNGFYLGYNGANFGIAKRTATVDTFTIRTSFSGDLLDGSTGSKFTRNGIPEAINLTYSNLFRIRYAWLGSASILFDVFSPDGLWVNFHTIRQPNSALAPSITVPNVPITLDVAKTSADATSLTVATACWAGGTTSPYAPITSTLTDTSLAGLTRSVITGVTTGGGGGYVNVKVNPSGALVGDFSNSTGLGVSSLPSIPAGSNNIGSITNITGTISLPTGAATSANQATMIANQTNGTQTARITDGTNTAAVKAASTAAAATDPALVVAISPNNTVAATQSGTWNINNIAGTISLPTGAATSANQTNGTQQSRITDGTNIAAVKAASTVPVASDPALVVSLSPNSATAPITLPDQYITGAAVVTSTTVGTNAMLAVAGLGSVDASGYKSGSIQVVSTATTGTFIFEHSNDNVNFVALPVKNTGLATGVPIITAITATASSIVYEFPIIARYIRVRAVTIPTSLTYQVFTRLSQAPYTSAVQAVAQGTAASLNTTVTGTITAVTSITNGVKLTSAKGQFIRNDFTVTNVTTSAYVQLIASTSAAYTSVDVYNSSGQTLVLAIGAAGSEVDQFIIPPVWMGRVPFTLATAQRIAVKALSANATTGELDINFYA